MSEYSPSDVDKFRADQAYVRYAGGVAIVHDPVMTMEMHGLSLTEDPEAILSEAVHMMVEGVLGVIRYAHPSELRKVLIMEDRYEEALPHMIETVRRVTIEQRSRLDALSPSIAPMQPAAMTQRGIYRNLCHGRRDKVTSRKLLDGILPFPAFRELSELSIHHFNDKRHAA